MNIKVELTEIWNNLIDAHDAGKMMGPRGIGAQIDKLGILIEKMESV
jgi:hypothetical protein